MKKTLSLVLAVIILLGCMSVTAFATTVPSWSYDAATDTITINYEIPAGAEVGANVPNPDFLLGDGININCIVFSWGMQDDDDAPYIYNGVHWNALDGTFASGNHYGYIIMIEYREKTVDHSNAKVILNGKTYTNLGGAGDGGINCQPFLIVDFGVLGADGKFTGGDFAETEPGKKSGSTDITAVKAAPLSYKLVIPQNVPTITKAGVTEIGAPSVEEVKNATEKTVISYTASGTQLTLEGDSKTMTTSYYTDSEGKTAMPSTAIEVYKSKALVNPLTTLYVGVAEDAWNAADAGTYHATVTFNFAAEEKAELPATMTITEMLDTVDGGFPTYEEYSKHWWDDSANEAYIYNGVLHAIKDIDITTTATKGVDGKYTTEPSVSDEHGPETVIFTFVMSDNKLTEIICSITRDEKGQLVTYTYSFCQ